MPVRGGQVEGGVVAHVGRVDPGAAGDEHLHDLGVAALGRPVQRRELVVIPVCEKSNLLVFAANLQGDTSDQLKPLIDFDLGYSATLQRQ